jgi:hypothetical protein
MGYLLSFDGFLPRLRVGLTVAQAGSLGSCLGDRLAGDQLKSSGDSSLLLLGDAMKILP